MPAKRCPACLMNWPSGSIKDGKEDYSFSFCPKCNEETEVLLHAQPVPRAEALSAAKLARFEYLYAVREAERIKEGRPRPEDDDPALKEILALEELWRGSVEES